MNTIISILKDVGGIITDDHFVYTSGKHGSVYVNKDALYPDIAKVSHVGKMFARRVKHLDIDAVVAPALGGIILSQWTAHHLSKLKKKKVLGLYTEKDENKNQVFTRGYDKLVHKKNILVIEDVANTGGSVKKTVTSVQNAHGTIVSVGVMINRRPHEINSDFFGLPFFSLGDLPAAIYEPEHCLLCLNNTPINTSVGHGKKYLESLGKNRA